MTKLWTFEKSPVCLVTVVEAKFAKTKLPFALKKTDPGNKFLNLENRLRTNVLRTPICRVQLEFVDSQAYFDALVLQYL